MLPEDLTGAPNDGFLLNTLKTLFGLSIVSTVRSLEMYSKRRYKIFICSIIMWKLESFQSYRGFGVIFTEILDAI